jgi:hypothetical protein
LHKLMKRNPYIIIVHTVERQDPTEARYGGERYGKKPDGGGATT